MTETEETINATELLDRYNKIDSIMDQWEKDAVVPKMQDHFMDWVTMELDKRNHLLPKYQRIRYDYLQVYSMFKNKQAQLKKEKILFYQKKETLLNIKTYNKQN